MSQKKKQGSTLVIVESPTKVPPLHERSEYEVREDPASIPMGGRTASRIEVAGSRPSNLALRARDMGGTKTTV